MTQNGVTGVLSTAQRRAIAALLTARNTRAAGVAANVAERTLSRWLSEPGFSAALAAAEGELLSGVTRRLLGLQDKALDALLAVFDDVEAGHALKLRAAAQVIDALLRVREVASIEIRLAALEAANQELERAR